MTVEVGSLTQLEPVLDAVPTALVLVEPGTARVLYVNPAAHQLAGAPIEKAADAAAYTSLYRAFDPAGRPLAADEYPGVRAARGERVQNMRVDWGTAAGRRAFIVSAHTVPLAGARRRRLAARALARSAGGGGGRRPAGGAGLRRLGVRRAPPARREHRARGHRDGGPVQARGRRGLRPHVPARPGLRGRLPPGHPHRRGPADRGDPRGVPRAGGARAAPARGAGGDGLPLDADRAAAGPRPGDRRPRARDGRVAAALRPRRPRAGP